MLTEFTNTADDIEPETVAIEDESPESEVDQALIEAKAAAKRAEGFVDGGIFSLKDKPLHPFSSGRRSLFEELRHAVGAGSLRSVLSDMEEHGEPAAFLPEAARILFLCFHSFDELIAIRLEAGSLVKIQIQIDKWLDESLPNELAQRAACALALQIFNQASLNQAEAAPRKGGVGNSKGGDSISLGESGFPIGKPFTSPLLPQGIAGANTLSDGISPSPGAGPITTAAEC